MLDPVVLFRSVRFWLHNAPPSMKNSRRIIYGGQSPRVIKSPEALQWADDALKQITGYHRLGLGSATRPVEVTLHIYYRDRRPDLSGDLVLDVLQDAGVISNDRHVYHLDLHKHFSKERPGVEVTVKEM